MELLFVLLAGVIALLVAALSDIVRASDLDDTTRLILAIAVVVLPPIGLLVWMVVRLGRTGVFITTAICVLVVVLGTVVTEGARGSNIQISTSPIHVRLGANSGNLP
jgi:hypothetical protein